MADAQQLDILMRGVNIWNAWRKEQPAILIDLSGADLHSRELQGIHFHHANLTDTDLSNTNLYGANLREADLTRTNLREANLREANLSSAYVERASARGVNLNAAQLIQTSLVEVDLQEAEIQYVFLMKASLRNVKLMTANLEGTDLNQATLFHVNLTGANLHKTNLTSANLQRVNFENARMEGAILSDIKCMDCNFSGLDLRGRDFSWAALRWTNLSGANLREANLRYAVLDHTNLEQADLTNSLVYRASLWDPRLKGAIQLNMQTLDEHEPIVTADGFHLAQFLTLMTQAEALSSMMSGFTANIVLILGYFPSWRVPFLDQIREELRMRGYLPVLFDRESATLSPPVDESFIEKDYSEMLKRLFSLARFALFDLTAMTTLPHEIHEALAHAPCPVQPLLHTLSHGKEALVQTLERYPKLLPLYQYEEESQVRQFLREYDIETLG